MGIKKIKRKQREAKIARAKLVENCKKVLVAIDFAPLTADQREYAWGCLLVMGEAGIEWNVRLDIEAEAAAHQLES